MITSTATPGGTGGRRSPSGDSVHLPIPTRENERQRLEEIQNIKHFLNTAPCYPWDSTKAVKQYLLPTGEHVSCVFWEDLFHMTGTDIVRLLVCRFHLFGRPVHNLKKFEEGIFSDLRSLKPDTDACLEEPKSKFLDMLYKHSCIRTQKKQKVFYWFSVPHDRLFYDALERDLKREKDGGEPTSTAVAEPALSFTLDGIHAEREKMKQPRQVRFSDSYGDWYHVDSDVTPHMPLSR